MAEVSQPLSTLLHTLARLSCPDDGLSLNFEPLPDEHRSTYDAIRAALPDADVSDEEILCLACFYEKSADADRLLSALSVEREMALRGLDRNTARTLISTLYSKKLIEIPTLERHPESEILHEIVDDQVMGERMRVSPAVAARLRLPVNCDVKGYASIREHLAACFALAELQHRAVEKNEHQKHDLLAGQDDPKWYSARDGFENGIRDKEAEIRVRESMTLAPTPLMHLVTRLHLDMNERAILVRVLFSTLQRETCQVRELEAELQRDPFDVSKRAKYFSLLAPLFYYDILHAERDAQGVLSVRADVRLQPKMREWLLTGKGDPLHGITGANDAAQARPYGSNREQMTDRLRYIHARRRMTATSRRNRWDEDTSFLPFAEPDEHEQERCREIEQGIEARCTATPRRFPLQDLVERCGLTKPERDVLLLLLERELCGLDTEVRDVLAFFDADVFELAKYRRLLAADAPLMRHGLVTLHGRTFDRADIELAENVRSELLAERPADSDEHIAPRLGPHSAFTVETVPQRLDDIVLPAAIRHTLRTALARYESGADERLRAWGVEASDQAAGWQGGAMRLLFSGPPGTGKTYTAGALANDLGRPLLVTDISKLLSCWVGDSEKNVRALFDEYDGLAARLPRAPVLLLNECDQFLGRRSAQAGRSVDRMYHQMQNIFLERIERFRGVLIATTNLVEAIDDAFSRRFHHKLVFPLPDAAARLAIWRVQTPAALPLAVDVDLATLAERFAFSGGQIAVAVRNAAIEAAVRGDAVCMQDLLDACISEQGGEFGAQPPAERQVGFMVRP